MKAIICPKYGPPEVLHLAETAKPVPKANEVLIKIYATTVTVADYRIRSFTVPLSYWLPARLALGVTKPKNPILGVELAGEVESVGSGVRRFKKGDRVFAATLSGGGAYAEYICLPEHGPIAVKPENISFEEAAAIPIGAQTALHYLRKANIQNGQTILIYGASGSVGTYAVQLAKYFGAVVTGVCSAANIDLVKSLGADKVIDYTKENFADTGEMFDIVFEAVNKSSFKDCIKVVKRSGIYINITQPIPTFRMLWSKLTTEKRLMLGENAPDTAELLNILKELIAAGKIKSVIDRCYTMEQIVEAHRYVEQGHKKGNVVVSIA
ncbi:MAG: NAD(P)-dependent alcohol dehydrogenase [Bacteroidota bacterium]